MPSFRWILPLVIAAPLAAQQPDSTARRHMNWGMRDGMTMGPHGMMGGHMEGMMGPMARVMAFSPGHLLMHREALSLTDQQVTRLSGLHDSTKTAEDGAQTEAQTHARAVASALAAANPDTAQLKSHFQQLHAALGRAHWAALSAAARARAILTETQRARVDGWADAMEQMMPARDHEGPRPGPR